MCNVNLRHTRKHSISTDDLLARLEIHNIETYIGRRFLNWAGKIARMDTTRLPRKLLSSWARASRPTGAPKFTYGRGLKKSLKWFNIPHTTWHTIAKNEQRWLELLKTTRATRTH